MTAPEALLGALTQPTPDSLWQLRAELLERGVSAGAPSLQILGELRAFLDRFATATSARDLNHLASKLDMGAIGGVVLEQLLERPHAKDLAMRILTGGISEGLMVLASRQYVRVQENELAALFRDTGWALYERLWRWTSTANPDLDAGQRRQLIDRITAPLRDPTIPGQVKGAVTGRLYQILLVVHLLDDLPGASA